MIYTLQCPDCDEITEFVQMMNDEHVAVDCPSCGRGMTRSNNRCYGMDNFDIRGETVAGSRQVSYDYMDPTLGHIKNRQDRKDKMKAAGLVDYEPNPEMHKHRVEAKRIRSQSNPAVDGDAARAISNEYKTAGKKRMRASIKKSFDDADKAAGIN